MNLNQLAPVAATYRQMQEGVTKKAVIELPALQMEKLASLLSDMAQDLGDDGRGDEPDVELTWKVQRIIAKAAH